MDCWCRYFKPCFGLTKSFREPGDLPFKGVRVLPSAYFVNRRIHFRMYIYKAKILFDSNRVLNRIILFANFPRKAQTRYQPLSSVFNSFQFIFGLGDALPLVASLFAHLFIFRRRPQSRRRTEANIKEENDGWRYHFKWRNSREKLERKERKVKTGMMDVAIQCLTKIFSLRNYLQAQEKL